MQFNDQYNIVEQNLKKILQTPFSSRKYQINAEEFQVNKQNNRDNVSIPINPLNKKLFAKKSRQNSKRQNQLDMQHKIKQQIYTEHQSKYMGSTSKRKKNIRDYLIQDITEKKIEQNNKFFSEIIEYVLRIKNQINDQIKCMQSLDQKYLNNSYTNFFLKHLNLKNQEEILVDIKRYFDQNFPLKNHSVDTKQFPKHIQTIIEFQTIENPYENEIYETKRNNDSNISYFKKSLYTLNTNDEKSLKKNSRITKSKNKINKSLQKTEKNSQSSYEKTCKHQVKILKKTRSNSIYQKVLLQRKTKRKNIIL